MMLSKKFFCVLSGAKIKLKNPKNFLENIQFEGLWTLLFLVQIVANHIQKKHVFDPWILEKIGGLHVFFFKFTSLLPVSYQSLSSLSAVYQLSLRTLL